MGDEEEKLDNGEWDGNGGITLSQDFEQDVTFGSNSRDESVCSRDVDRQGFGFERKPLKAGDAAEVQIISGPNMGSWIDCHIVEVKKNGTFDIYVGETESVWNGPRFCKDIVAKFVREKRSSPKGEANPNTLQVAEALNNRATNAYRSSNVDGAAQLLKYYKHETYFGPSERDFQSDFNAFTVKPLDFVVKLEVTFLICTRFLLHS
jgi:hypothetical protein